MSEEILINVTPQETRVAIVEQGIVQELHIERSSSLGLVGNISWISVPSVARHAVGFCRSGLATRSLLACG